MTDPNDAKVVVIGSMNMDLVVRVAHVPAPGETVLGRGLQTIPGGKGGNQALAVARLGVPCQIIGRIGNDDFGHRLISGLTSSGVDTSRVLITEGVPSGVAMIVVDHVGENAICVASGANYKVRPEDLDEAEGAIATANICLLQLELPLDTVIHALELCRKHGVETILDTAPAPAEMPAELFGADIITPNQHEAEALCGERSDRPREAKAVAAAIVAKGAKHVVLKLGDRGAMVYDGDRFELVAGHKIATVDTTAAGDAFTGALAAGRARGQSLIEATRFANAAGAAACTKFGAQPSMPSETDVLTILQAE